jgi:hypothetical protein
MPSSPRGFWRSSCFASCAFFVAFLTVARARVASAEETLRIVVVRADAESTIAKRLEGELRSLGLVVVAKPMPEGGKSRAELEDLARRENAIAAVQVIAHGTRAELWIADRVTDKTVFREIVTTSRSGDRADDTIAVGVAELLRASLMEVNAPSGAAHAQPLTPKIRELGYSGTKFAASANLSTPWLALGSGIEAGARGAGLSMVVQAAAGFQTLGGFGFEGFIGMTLVPAVLDNVAGKASLTARWFGAAGTLEFVERGAALSGRAGLGMAAVRLEARGERASLPFTTTTEASWSAGPYLHGGPALSAGWLRLRLDGSALLLLRAPTIRFGDEAVAVWGGPALFLTLGFEALSQN